MSKVLIVEDQSDIRRLIRWALEFDGHEIREAANGETGLAVAKVWRPDMMVLDVMMPGRLDGLQVCEQVKADPLLSSSTRVLLLSARTQQRDKDAGLRAGADAYLGKPFSPLELSATITRLLARTPPPPATGLAERPD